MIFLTIIIFLFSLGVLILVHEFGHFIAAKKTGVTVEEFCIGFPPRIWSKKYKGTVYSLGAIPFGGFVNMAGEFTDSKKINSFSKKSISRRVLITVAGVAMNFLLAIFIFALGFSTVGLPMESSEAIQYGGQILKNEITILDVVGASPAQLSGIQTKDVILKLDNQSFTGSDQIQNYFQSKAGQEVNLLIKRNDETFEKKIIVGKDGDNKGKIGIAYAIISLVRFSILKSFKMAFLGAFRLVILVLGFFADLITRAFRAPEVLKSVSGPIGIFFLIKESIILGLPYFLFLIGQISATLAIINILPFPALDGSRLLFLAVEKIRGKRVTAKIENAIYGIGFILLLALIVLISYQDVLKYILGR